MIKVKILGVEFSAPFLNPSFRKKYEDELAKVVEISNKAETCEKGSDCIFMQCNAVIDCMNNILGEGAAQKIFGEETDLEVCLDAFMELCSVQENFINPIIENKMAAFKKVKKK